MTPLASFGLILIVTNLHMPPSPSIPRPVVYVVNLNLCTVVSNNKTPEKKETYKCRPNDATGIIWVHFPCGQPPISLSNVYWIK